VSTRLLFWAIWLTFGIYAFGFAPPDQADSFPLIVRLSSGQWQGINPYVVALFNIMGIWPVIYSGVMLTDGQLQSRRAWPFVVVSFAVGAFAILPYLALRTSGLKSQVTEDRFLAIANSRWLGVALLASAVGLLAYAITQGDWLDFVQQWHTSRFIHVMSLDFCLLCLLFPVLLKDDWARRKIPDSWPYWLFALPLVGAALYLTVRPSLSDLSAHPPAETITDSVSTGSQ
jgi:hypothetical protein